MSDPDSENVAIKASPPSGKSGLILGVVGLNLVGMLGLAAYIVLGPKPGATSGAHGHAQESKKPQELGPLIPDEPLVVNLRGEEPHYLKLTYQFEARDAKAAEVVTKGLVPLRDRILSAISTLTVADTRADGKREELRTKLKEELNRLLGDTLIRNLYFTEFVVQ